MHSRLREDGKASGKSSALWGRKLRLLLCLHNQTGKIWRDVLGPEAQNYRVRSRQEPV